MPNWVPPSLSSVRAFEAAARRLNFTHAAKELHVTQSAVSHGVRDLELRLGAALFVRDGRGLALSEAGRAYLPFAADALQRLRGGDRAVLDPQRKARVLTVSVSPSFAAKWLVPRLGAFAAAHSDLDLRLSANPQHIDFADGEIDLAVRHGVGIWPGLDCVKLCDELLFPVCSPAFARAHRLRKPENLAGLPLIHHRDAAAWRDWLAGFGVALAPQDAHGPALSEMSLAIDAAIAGQGAALARSALAARDLADGRLVRPMRHSAKAPFGYWIVCPRERADAAKILRFRAWLLAEAAADSEPPRPRRR